MESHAPGHGAPLQLLLRQCAAVLPHPFDASGIPLHRGAPDARNHQGRHETRPDAKPARQRGAEASRLGARPRRKPRTSAAAYTPAAKHRLALISQIGL